ncbi:protein SLENDER RICE1-LIKE 1-like [Typha angustifolia]|uniref:protein SLENDER RICE1-LIKE 1-like n=1 Tax=Typha angustifolia TaxID=59011 RepID=UPI003C2DFCF2
MGPYPPSSGSEIDGLLARVGYRIRPSDLRHVAHGLERLDSAMVGGDNRFGDSDAVHYNPSDLAAWVDSMLSESTSQAAAEPTLPLSDGAWMAQIIPQLNQQHHHQMAAIAARQRKEEEDSGIRLVHLLMGCADAVQRGESRLAASLLDEMRVELTRMSTSFGIGKVAGYFVDALRRRLYSATDPYSSADSLVEYEILYHHFYEACPYLKFAHFTANQAILEAFDGYDRVHVIDFSLMQGLQWPALIQALALRPGGPPFLRITGIGPPSSNGRDELREIGIKLAELARSVHVRFAFRGVAATHLDDVRPWMLHVGRGEAVAVNSVLQLHRLLGDPGKQSAIDSVLNWVVGLRPKIVTVVEQEADHNKPGFLDRFTEALFYYSTVFDSLEAKSGLAPQKPTAEMYLQRELCNIVCCEGSDRVERHEPLVNWRTRLGQSGLIPVHLGSNAFKQASMLLTLFSAEGYCVEEVDGCLLLGWHSRPLISASAWRASDHADDYVAPDNITLVDRCSIANNNNNNENSFN